MADFDVLVLGGVGVDTIVRVPGLEIPAGDVIGVPPVRDYVAHSGNGVALGFHRLGLRTKFADMLGEDALGALVLARYAQLGLDFSYLPAANGTAFMSRWLAGRPVAECMLAGAVSGAFARGAHGTHEEQIDEQQLAAGMTRAAATAQWRSGRA